MSANKFRYVIAKYNYTAQGTEELDLERNAKYLLLNDEKHWWQVQNVKGQCGYVPSNYVKREGLVLFDSLKKTFFKTSTGSKSLPSSSSRSSMEKLSSKAHITTPTYKLNNINAIVSNINQVSDNPSKVIGTGIVKYEYHAQQLDELTLVKGTKIKILEKSNDGWWIGQYKSHFGWFPSNYIEELNLDEHFYVNELVENVTDIMEARCDFTSQIDKELNFVKGDKLKIIDRLESCPDWYQAINLKNGKVGLVPINYLQNLSDVNTPNPNNNKYENELLNTHKIHTEEQNSSYRKKLDRFRNLIFKKWYFGSLLRSQCEELFNDKGVEGDFIIRDSETNEGDLSLSVKSSEGIKHFIVHIEKNQYCIGNRKFTTLEEVIEHYQKSPIFTNKQGKKLYLVRAFSLTRL